MNYPTLDNLINELGKDPEFVKGYGFVENLYNLNNYPQDIRPIIEVLLRHEDRLSDGFIYYLPSYSNEEDDCGQCKILQSIAREILAAVDKERPF